jgi:hypothetical protein
MRGRTGPAFVHEEGLWTRLWQIPTIEPRAQVVLLCLCALGLIICRKKHPSAVTDIGAYAGLGFGWGYLAASWPALAFLQLGRHTYALYTAASVAGGLALAEVVRRLAARSRLAAIGAAVVLVVGFAYLFAADLAELARLRVVGSRQIEGEAGRPSANVPRIRVVKTPFLSSKPSPRLRWVVDQIRAHVKPGERVLYEESGADLEGVPDPYQHGRYSGLLPYLTGVEVIGGPYLHAALKTNFTQFGEGSLFGRSDWDLDFLVRHAALYRPAAIVCWSPHAVAFCLAHPDLIEVEARDERLLPVFDTQTGRFYLRSSVLLFGRVRGFGGAAVFGEATMSAEPGRLRIASARAAELDGLVVLGYHFVPRLRSRPAVPLEPVRLEDDPVPFIGFRPPGGPFVVEMTFQP